MLGKTPAEFSQIWQHLAMECELCGQRVPLHAIEIEGCWVLVCFDCDPKFHSDYGSEGWGFESLQARFTFNELNHTLKDERRETSTGKGVVRLNLQDPKTKSSIRKLHISDRLFATF
jgi:hypothetical protein